MGGEHFIPPNRCLTNKDARRVFEVGDHSISERIRYNPREVWDRSDIGRFRGSENKRGKIPGQRDVVASSLATTT